MKRSTNSCRSQFDTHAKKLILIRYSSYSLTLFGIKSSDIRVAGNGFGGGSTGAACACAFAFAFAFVFTFLILACAFGLVFTVLPLAMVIYLN